MKTPAFVATLTAALALGAAVSTAAMAQEVTYEYPQAVVSQTTRGAVLADLKQARADGTLFAGEVQPQAPAKFFSTVTRAEVKAQTLAAIASGELRALHSELGVPLPASHAPAATVVAGK